jgi:hypothetical protein
MIGQDSNATDRPTRIGAYKVPPLRELVPANQTTRELLRTCGLLKLSTQRLIIEKTNEQRLEH